ncbi:hypothetical protein TI04_11530, partial [Achromatium sp. WMS2]
MGFIKTLRETINRGMNNACQEWLNPYYDNLLWCLELNQVSNPLDDGLLWDMGQTGGDGLKAVDSKHRRPDRRLRSALLCHKKAVQARNRIAGRMGTEHKCFTNVIVCISDITWRRDIASNNGVNIKALANNLCCRHAQDFKGSIQEGRSPRYLIRADSRLKPDQVVFWFGNGIYFPRLGEPPELYVGLELDGLIIAPPTLSG